MKKNSSKQPAANAAKTTPLLVFVTVMSALTSFVFVFYGLTVTLNEGSSQSSAIFAYVVAGYGLGNIYILSAAWRSGGRWPAEASKLMGLCFLGIFLFDTINAGIAMSSALLGHFGVLLILWANWYSIKQIALRH